MRAHATRRHYAFLAATLITLGLAACGEKQPADDFTQIPPPPAPADRQADRSSASRTAEDANESLKQAEKAVQERTAEAGLAVEDATITARVKSALGSDAGLRTLSINVDTFAGIVTLKGTANTQENRKKAEQVASSVDGVRSVRNELVVIPS